jgi:hypothetical protein
MDMNELKECIRQATERVSKYKPTGEADGSMTVDAENLDVAKLMVELHRNHVAELAADWSEPIIEICKPVLGAEYLRGIRTALRLMFVAGWVSAKAEDGKLEEETEA